MTSIITPTDVHVALHNMLDDSRWADALFAEWCDQVGLVRVADETPVKQPGTFRIGKTERDVKSGAALRHKRNREARRQFNKAMHSGTSDLGNPEQALAQLKDMGLMH